MTTPTEKAAQFRTARILTRAEMTKYERECCTGAPAGEGWTVLLVGKPGDLYYVRNLIGEREAARNLDACRVLAESFEMQAASCA